MTHSPTPQLVHCPPSHPSHPLTLLPPSPALEIDIANRCCCCSSAQTSPHLHHRHHRSQQLPLHHHYHHHHHHHHQVQFSAFHHHHHHLQLSEGGERVAQTQSESQVDRTSSQSQAGHQRRCRSCASSGSTHSSPGPAAAAEVGVSASRWQWCWTLLAFPVLPFLLILPHRRKGRRPELSQVPRLLLTVGLLTMLAGRCLASPWIEENADSVKLRAKICQPVSEEHLQGMLGKHYDPSRMSNKDPRTVGKRADPTSQSDAAEKTYDSYYMDDDPGAGGYMSEDFVDIVTENGEEEGWFRQEEEEVEEDGAIVEEKDFEEEFYRKKSVGNVDSLQSDQPNPRSRGTWPSNPDQRYLYMKRRRRGANRQDRPTSRKSDSSFGKDKKNKDSLLPLRLLLSGRNRKLRRKLKKAFRKKAKRLGKKPPPWTCNMTKVWGRLKDGFFPRYLLDGRCATDKCFYRLYNCVPQKYRVNVLERDPDYCNPLPALTANSTYEQKWSVVRYYVTVGCNCEASDPLQRSPSGRRSR